jgi:hypothetical protein
MVVATPQWNAGANGPKTVAELRTALTKKAKAKKGKALIADRFTREHIFAGHSGEPSKMAAMLAKLRGIPASTLILSSMDQSAQAEVLNWIENVPAAGLARNGTTWQIANRGTTVEGTLSYKWATVDWEAYQSINSDDRVKKARNWLKLSQKTPKVACQFGPDGTPVIYHLDY